MDKAKLLASINQAFVPATASVVRNAETNPNMAEAMRRAILKGVGKRTDAEIEAILAACPSVRK